MAYLEVRAQRGRDIALITGTGILLFVLAILHTAYSFSIEHSGGIAYLLELFLLGAPALGVLWITYETTTTEIEEELYRTIVYWCVTGALVMLVVVLLALYYLGAPLWNHDALFVYHLGIGLGAFGGVSVGYREARAVTNAREAAIARHRQQETQQERDRLEEFASIISHDLRNPLSVANGNLELLRQEFESSHIEEIATALERMDNIIEDTLMLARAGQAVGETAPVELTDSAKVCWQTVATEEATLQIEDSITFEADADRLNHLFENLYRNAIQHGGDDVTIRVGTLEDRAGFYIEDDGPGIPESDRNKVFESGYSASSDGTGFGLSIVKTIVDAHGWDITVTDGRDGGARFEISDIKFAE